MGSSVFSTQSWPTKPVRIVVPFAAGGPADALARFLANKMAPDIGQTILIDNKGGAGGTLLSTRSPCRWFEALMNYTLDYDPVCATSWATEGLGPAMYVTP